MSKRYNETDCIMKDYERTNRHFLTPKTPVIIRIDGKAFHMVLSKFKPMDEKVSDVMTHVAVELLEFIQGAKIVYTQSDEISILLTDYDRDTTCSWFGYRVDKICSVTASFATQAFILKSMEMDDGFFDKLKHPVCFDSRCFNIAEEDVFDYFNWRQLDAKKNSVSSYGRTFFTQKQLFKKSGSAIMDMLDEIKKPWKDLPFWAKYGKLYVQAPEAYFEEEVQKIKFVPKLMDEVPLFKDPNCLDFFFRKEHVRATRDEFRKLKKEAKKIQKGSDMR